jgi:hypothetical protein
MGLGFCIDDAPHYLLDGEPVEQHEAMSILEDGAYWLSTNKRERVTIEIVSSEIDPEVHALNADFTRRARWAYSGFNRFRNRLTEQVFGFTYDALLESGIGSKMWAQVAEHPLYPLLNHSDCDGDLSPEDCHKVGMALRGIVAAWDDDDYDKEQALRLASMMEMCAKHERRLIFC